METFLLSIPITSKVIIHLGLVEQDHEQTQSLPNINFAGGIQNNKTADIQSSKSSYSVGPYGHHKSRGKDMISRIRNDSLPYESEEEDEYTNGEIYNHKQQNGECNALRCAANLS